MADFEHEEEPEAQDWTAQASREEEAGWQSSEGPSEGAEEQGSSWDGSESSPGGDPTGVFAGLYDGPALDTPNGELADSTSAGELDHVPYSAWGTIGKLLGKAAKAGVKGVGSTAGDKAKEAARDGSLGEKIQSGKLREEIGDDLMKSKWYPNTDNLPWSLLDNPITGLIENIAGFAITSDKKRIEAVRKLDDKIGPGLQRLGEEDRRTHGGMSQAERKGRM